MNAGIGDDTGHNGQCWTQAYATLEKALGDLNDTGLSVVEIRIAGGTYSVPDENGSFLVTKGCLISGGYAGTGGTPNAWDPDAYHSILTGDVDGDDDPGTPGSDSENASHVLEIFNGLGFSGDVTLEGLEIEAGRAIGGSGGGVYVNTGASITVTLSQCILRDNIANLSGGALACGTETLVLRRCTLERNICTLGGLSSIQLGGGIYAQGSLTAVLCNFIENEVVKEGCGGAIYAGMNPLVPFRLTLCTFDSNTAIGGELDPSISAGAVGIHDEDAVLEATGCLFIRNRCSRIGGAVAGRTAETENGPTDIGTLVARDCTFADNEAEAEGCAIACKEVDLGNSIVFFNTATDEEPPPVFDQQIAPGAESIVISYSCVEDLDLIEFDDNNIKVDPVFEDRENGDYWLKECSPAINKGSSGLIPADVTDVDDNPSTEDLPWDLIETAREKGLTVDMGAYEQAGHWGTCPPDFDESTEVDGDDIGTLLGYWGIEGGFSIADFNCDGIVDGDDMGELLGWWGPCPGSESRMFGGGGNSMSPQAAAEEFGMNTIEEFVEWLSGLDFSSMSDLLQELFGN